MTAPLSDWENVPPEEWPFVYLIQQPGAYVINCVETYRDLYGTWYSTEPIDLKPGDLHDPGEGEPKWRVRSVEPPPEPGYQALVRFEWAGEPPLVKATRGRALQFYATDDEIAEWLPATVPEEFAPYRVVVFHRRSGIRSSFLWNRCPSG